MLPKTSKQLVEARYGRSISDAEYDAALEYATMKLNFQAELFHREFDTAYVTQVVMEGLNLCPQQWKLGTLTTGPPGDLNS